MNITAMTDATRWQAVLSRDARFDTQFVYAVKTTGIYCVPSCPSRKPAQRNVTFFAVPEAAEHANYRACKRCKPREQTPRNPHVTRVRAVCRYIEQNLNTPLTLDALAAQANLSPQYLQRHFKALVGVSPQRYTESCRLRFVKTQLHNGESISASLYDAGYNSSSALYGRASTHLGMTPAQYQKRGDRMMLRFTTCRSDLGEVLVAASDKGICSVTLGDDAAVLEAGLRAEFTDAVIARDDAGLRDWLDAVMALIAGRQPHEALPLDIKATAFQSLVWEALKKIPLGETRSYAQVAQAIGRPSAVRAVARACATNPVALVVPCHRVVRSDGGVSGYRWGVARKQALLAKERDAQD